MDRVVELSFVDLRRRYVVFSLGLSVVKISQFLFTCVCEISQVQKFLHHCSWVRIFAPLFMGAKFSHPCAKIFATLSMGAKFSNLCLVFQFCASNFGRP